MNIQQEELDRWAQFVDEVRVKMPLLDTLIAQRKLPEARAMAMALHLSAASVLARMEREGAGLPDYLPAAPNVPLELLTSEKNRRFARALREAVEAAVEVDKERDWFPAGPSCLLADTLHRVEVEVYGPNGKGEGV